MRSLLRNLMGCEFNRSMMMQRQKKLSFIYGSKYISQLSLSITFFSNSGSFIHEVIYRGKFFIIESKAKFRKNCSVNEKIGTYKEIDLLI